VSGLLWGNPLAWLGLAAIGVPILVHLLAMRRATRVPFPTLRFLRDSAPTSMRRHRIEDVPLLLLRCLIIAVAVAALAQPWVTSEGRTARDAGRVARAVVVDTSSSMNRDTSAGGAALTAARAAAARLIDGVASATIIESPHLGAGVARAAVWLRAAAAAGSATELVVISDFQVGAMKSSDLSPLPAAAGVQLQRFDVAAESAFDMPRLRVGEQQWQTTVTLDDEQTTAAWSKLVDTPSAAGAAAIDWRADTAEQAGAEAAMAAASEVVALPIGAADRPVTVVWPAAPERGELIGASAALDEPWMVDVLAAMPPEGGVTAAGYEGRMLLFAEAQPGSLASASLAAALLRATAVRATPVAELEPRVMGDESLRGWERLPGEVHTPAGSDGRWLWLVVLGLLLVEQRVRRRPEGDRDVA